MKKIISLISAVAVVLSFAVCPVSADDTNTPVFSQAVEFTTNSGKDLARFAAITGDAVIDIEYNIPTSDSTTVNVPICLRDANNSEITRGAIFGTSSGNYINASFSSVNTVYGFVKNQGRIRLLYDRNGDTATLTMQYFGDDVKKESLLFDKLPVAKVADLVYLNVGASGTPVGTTLDIKVYSVADASTYRTINKIAYSFDNSDATSVFNSSIKDFKRSSSFANLAIGSEGTNHFVQIPVNTTMTTMTGPVGSGFTGQKVFSKNKVKLSTDNWDGESIAISHFKPSDQKTISTITFASDNTIRVRLGNSATGEVKVTPNFVSGWHEIIQVLDFDGGTNNVYIDGVLVTETALGIPEGCNILTKIDVTNSSKNTLCIDDIEHGYCADEVLTSANASSTGKGTFTSTYLDTAKTARKVFVAVAAYDSTGTLLKVNSEIVGDNFTKRELILADGIGGASIVKAFLWEPDTMKPIDFDSLSINQ